MQDLAYLHKKGGTEEQLRKKLTQPIKDKKIKELISIHEQRLLTSIRKNCTDARHWWTIDRIIDSGMRNMNFVAARELLTGKPFLENDKIIAKFEQWGLHQMLTPAISPDGKPMMAAGNRPIMELNVPVFDTVFVPLVSAYRTMRWASLFNQRNAFPLYNYAPSKASTKHLAQTEVITSVISRMSSDMGYTNDTKQCILGMLDYGMVLRMPSCAWHREEYDTTDKGKTVTLTQREGVNFVIPRPERTFVDLSHPLTTINTDTGCSYYGYWDLVKYGTIKRNKKFFNTDCVNYGASSSLLFGTPEWAYMGELFPCTMRLPTCPDGFDSTKFDRLDKAFWYSSTSEEDAACPITVIFDKLVPSDWGLFDYDKPVWTRWVYADTATPLYCEVLPYSPGAAYLYDYDANRAFQTSLTSLLSPFQQMFGNFLTQHYIAVRNNLPRITFYNTDIVSKEDVERMKAQKSRLYQELTFLPFSKREQSFQQQAQTDAFVPLTFPQANTAELASTLRLTLEVLERMLGFPSQQVGQPASHEQTAKEILVISGHGQTRSDFDGDGVDSAEKAVKRMVYDAWVNYGSDTVTATVVGVSPEKRAALKVMGFEIEEGESNKSNTFGVKGPKSALVLASFATDQEGNTRSQDPKVAIAMMQSLSVALQNEALFMALGVEQIVQLINDVFVWAGMPDDFRLNVDKSAGPQAQQAEMVKVLEQAKGDIMKAAMEQQQKMMGNIADGIKKQVIEPTQAAFKQVGEKLAMVDQQNQQQDEILKKMMEVLAGAMGAPSPGMRPPGLVGPDGPMVPPEMNGGPMIPNIDGPPVGPPIPVGAEPGLPGPVVIPPGIPITPPMPQGPGGPGLQ